MKKIKVLHTGMAASGGGISNYIMNLWRHIDRDVFQFDVVTFSKSIPFEQELLETGCKIHYMTCRAEEDYEGFRREFLSILDYGYDVIHLNTGHWKSLAMEELAREWGVKKIIVHAHNSGSTAQESVQRRHEELKEQFSMELATDLCACSGLAAEYLFKPSLLKEKITILKNGIETHKFVFNNQVRNDIRNELDIKDDEILLGNVGRLSYQKNHEFLVDVFSEIHKLNNKYKLLLVGDGELRDELTAKIRNLKLEDFVVITGYTNKVECYLQAMDIFVFPSRFEGFPISLIEAQTAGLPVIVSDTLAPEVLISSMAKAVNLEIKEWIDTILEINFTNNKNVRIGQYNNMKALGFDINDSVKVVEKLYLSK